MSPEDEQSDAEQTVDGEEDETTSDGVVVERSLDDVSQTSKSFVYLSLEGDRFNAAGMPADSTREIGILREAVLQVAREMWLDANPGRRRVPNGFDDGFDLRLTAVERGSARPSLYLNRPTSRRDDTEWDEWSTFYVGGRDALADFLNRESASASPSGPALRARSLAAAKRIGTTLGSSDSITVGSPDPDGPRAFLDLSVRETLQSIVEVLPDNPTEVEVEGFITEFDSRLRSFRLATSNGECVCRLDRYDESLATVVRSNLALDGLNAPDVRVTGDVWDENARTLQLVNVRAIQLVRSLSTKYLFQQVLRIAGLQDGWLGPGSKAASPELLDVVNELIARLSTISNVQIVPSSNGGVVIERQTHSRERSVTVEEGPRMFLCDDDLESDDLWENDLEYEANRAAEFLANGSHA